MTHLRRYMDTGSWIGVALGIATFLISVGVAVAQKANGDPTWKWAVALAVLGLLGTAVSAAQGLSSAAEATAAQKEIASAKTAAADAQGKLQELEGRHSVRIDLMTREKRVRFVERLKTLPAKTVDVVFDTQDRETADLGVAFESMLHEAGCLREAIRIQVMGRNPNLKDTGISVIHPGSKPAAIHIALRDALIEVGLPDVRLDGVTNWDARGGRLAIIAVSRKQ